LEKEAAELALDAIEQDTLEIAKLIHEKSRLKGKVQPSFLSIVEGNIEAKIKEFQQKHGAEPDAEQLKRFVSKLEKESDGEREKQRLRSNSVRDKESQTMGIARTVFTEDLGEFEELSPLYFTTREPRSAIMWTEDEKYVAFKNTSGQIRFYDTEE